MGSACRQLGVSSHRCQWKLSSAPKVTLTNHWWCAFPTANEHRPGLKPRRCEHSFESSCHFVEEYKGFFPKGGEIQRASSRLDWGTVLKSLWGLIGKHNGVYCKWQLGFWRWETLGAEEQDCCFMYMVLQLEVTLALRWQQHFFTSLRSQWRGCTQAAKAKIDNTSAKEHWKKVEGTHPLPKLTWDI